MYCETSVAVFDLQLFVGGVAGRQHPVPVVPVLPADEVYSARESCGDGECGSGSESLACGGGLWL